MYEVEIKVELTHEERKAVIKQFKEKGFEFKGITPQNDFYIEAKESPYGGFDLKRYRREGDTFIYTEKIWEMAGDTPARKENEHKVTQNEFNTETAKYPEAIKIIKDREWIAGNYQGKDISITIDSAKFNHSTNMRYFIEGEIDVENIEDVASTKQLILSFLSEILNTSEIKESPGMFMMAFNKL